MVRFAQLIALRGDSHSTLSYGKLPEFAACAVHFEPLSDGVFVTRIDKAHRAAIGGRVVRVGETPIEAALEAIATVRASENEQWRRGNAAILRRPAVLFGLGLLNSSETLSLVIDRDGVEHEISLAVKANGAETVSAFDAGAPDMPLWLTRGSSPYWRAWLDGGATLYFPSRQVHHTYHR